MFYFTRGQPIYKPGSVIASHLSSPIVADRIKRIIAHISERELVIDMLPCSRQGLPPLYVTIDCCGLLPHSFHLYPAPFSAKRLMKYKEETKRVSRRIHNTLRSTGVYDDGVHQ